MNLAGKTVIVTGAGSGMGRGVCEEFAKAGANVALFDVSKEAIIDLCEELGDRTIYAVVDVTNTDDILKGIRRAVEAFGAIHVCVNCAGTPSAMKTLDKDGAPHDLDVFRRVIEVNLIGTFNVLRLTAAEMARNTPVDGERGVIINTSSGAAQDGQAGQAAYGSSKAAVEGLALPVARDLAAFGIRVNTISPGLFDTTMVNGLPDKVRTALTNMILHPKRMGLPVDYAILARHIVENPYLNTACIRLDAGIRLAAR